MADLSHGRSATPSRLNPSIRDDPVEYVRSNDPPHERLKLLCCKADALSARNSSVAGHSSILVAWDAIAVNPYRVAQFLKPTVPGNAEYYVTAPQPACPRSVICAGALLSSVRFST